MFSIRREKDGRVFLSGRLDAAQADKARTVLEKITTPSVLDLTDLEYISSAGLRVLLETQKRLMDAGHSLTLVNLQKRIQDLFRVAGFDSVFDIE